MFKLRITKVSIAENTTLCAQWATLKLGVIYNDSLSNGKWHWKNTTGRTVTVTISVFSYCAYVDDGYCYTYVNVSSDGTVSNSCGILACCNANKSITAIVPSGYYVSVYVEGNVDRATLYLAEE